MQKFTIQNGDGQETHVHGYTMQVQFYGYTVQTDTLRKGQMILAQAKRERESGDIDKWFYAGCPVGRAYKKWIG